MANKISTTTARLGPRLRKNGFIARANIRLDLPAKEQRPNPRDEVSGHEND
jgi:hypothetical protein